MIVFRKMYAFGQYRGAWHKTKNVSIVTRAVLRGLHEQIQLFLGLWICLLRDFSRVASPRIKGFALAVFHLPYTKTSMGQ